MAKNIHKDERRLRERLTPEQYQVTQKGSTEPPFTGELLENKEEGVYRCVVCGAPLFDSKTKYDSGTGWPSFYAPAGEESVALEEDRSLFMRRTEVLCASCEAHLGHVFEDGPRPTGQRYCINSASLDFDPADKPAGKEQSPE